MLRFTTDKRGCKQIFQHGFEVKAPDGGERLYLGATGTLPFDEGPIHVQTPQGPRTAIKRVDYVERPSITFEVWVLSTHASETRHIGENDVVQMLRFAQENGVGADRSQGRGKFDVTGFDVLQRAEKRAEGAEKPARAARKWGNEKKPKEEADDIEPSLPKPSGNGLPRSLAQARSQRRRRRHHGGRRYGPRCTFPRARARSAVHQARKVRKAKREAWAVEPAKNVGIPYCPCRTQAALITRSGLMRSRYSAHLRPSPSRMREFFGTRKDPSRIAAAVVSTTTIFSSSGRSRSSSRSNRGQFVGLNKDPMKSTRLFLSTATRAA